MGRFGYIEVDMFPPEVDHSDHPEAVRFKGLLQEVAEEYRCRLVFFEVQAGTVTFAFDSEELTAEILKVLTDHGRNQA